MNANECMEYAQVLVDAKTSSERSAARKELRSTIRAAINAAVLAEREACAKIARDFVWYKAEKCAPDEANERIAQLIEARSNVEVRGAAK